MGLATFEGPQLLILDEPTNHLDIDSRAELIEAINDYEGACILISHDRRLLEACADRLWLVAGGQVRSFRRRSRRLRARSCSANPDASRRRPRRQGLAGRPTRKSLVGAANRRRGTENAAISGACWQRVDEALAKARGDGAASPQAIDLAAKRGNLKRALVAAEETWLELVGEGGSDELTTRNIAAP